MLPDVGAPSFLEIPEVDPAKYATLDMYPKFSYILPNTITSEGALLYARMQYFLMNYTIDGVAQASNIGDKIIIEKGSVRKIDILNVRANMILDIFNTATTLMFQPDVTGSAVAQVYTSPVVTLWY